MPFDGDHRAMSSWWSASVKLYNVSTVMDTHAVLFLCALMEIGRVFGCITFAQIIRLFDNLNA